MQAKKMGDNRNKKYYYRKSKKKYFLESGFRGFFCTCNFREKDCLKEAYNILNEYADKMYSDIKIEEEVRQESESDSGTEEESDIGDQLKREVENMKKNSQKSLKNKRFQAVETGASNCLFIKTNLPHPEELTSAILKDLIVTKTQRTRYLLRMVPIMATCKANLPDIMECAGRIFDNHFLKEASTFAIVFNKRFNNSLSRDLLIKELADMIVLKNCGNKADLKNPQLCVIIEIIKGICLLSVISNYYTYKKYNLHEVCKEETATETEKGESEPKKLKTEDSACAEPAPEPVPDLGNTAPE